MTYQQSSMRSVAAILFALLCTASSLPAKLDHLASQHSRGGFRAGTHDTGIWGANLDKQRNLTPPRWGPNNLDNTVGQDTVAGAASGPRGTVLNQNFGAKAILGAGQGSHQTGGSSHGPQFALPSTPNRGYVPPPVVAQSSQQGYSYNPPQVPVNLYQPPAPPTTTTRRPPPPPPTGLYQTPTQYRPVPQRAPTTTRRPPTTTRRPTTTTRRPPPPPPTGLYQTPQASQPVPQRVPSKATMIGMPYDFAYGVSDSNSGNYYTREEKHDGNVMRGQYSVLLPDGRTQVVTYFDDGNGFNAEVTYQ